MSGTNGVLPSVIRRSLYWLAGIHVPVRDGKPTRWDLEVQLLTREGTVGVAAGVMTHQLTGEVRTVRRADGGEDQVQTFRYVQADGSSGVLLLCGCCGRVVGLRSERVDLEGLKMCDACGAPRSVAMCVRGHAFGACPECERPGGVL